MMHVFEPYPLDRYTAAIVFFFVTAFGVCYLHSGFDSGEERNGYHEEIIPYVSASYLKDQQPIPLPDGCYALAVPSKDDFLPDGKQRMFPLFLILIPENNSFRLYPINLSDHSILERNGQMLALHHLLVFSGKHAENSLRYDEKNGINHASAADDYAKKAFYYLSVINGYGEIQRGYMSKENAGHAVRWYKDLKHVKEELLTIHFIIHDYPAEKIEKLVMEHSDSF